MGGNGHRLLGRKQGPGMDVVGGETPGAHRSQCIPWNARGSGGHGMVAGLRADTLLTPWAWAGSTSGGRLSSGLKSPLRMDCFSRALIRSDMRSLGGVMVVSLGK